MRDDADRLRIDRRACFASGAGMLALALVPSARATTRAMEDAIQAFVKGAPLISGRITLDVPPLTENGNSVPLSVSVESPMTAADHVTSIAVFNEKNPQPGVAVATLGPRSGRAFFATRVRLADSQKLTAVARMSDGRCFIGTADVVVTLAACLEG
jgi:sulfur-oxidizing protein SoxY